MSDSRSLCPQEMSYAGFITSDVPQGDSSFRVDVKDFVPHVDDLQEILSSMGREFNSGSKYSTIMYFISKCLNRRQHWGSEAVVLPRTTIFIGMHSPTSRNGTP